MARFTLSVSDDVAALDACAAENELNRSQAAEQIFRSFLKPSSGGEEDGEGGGEQGTGELKGIENHRQPRRLPEPPWVRRDRGY